MYQTSCKYFISHIHHGHQRPQSGLYCYHQDTVPIGPETILNEPLNVMVSDYWPVWALGFFFHHYTDMCLCLCLLGQKDYFKRKPKKQQPTLDDGLHSMITSSKILEAPIPQDGERLTRFMFFFPK